MRIERESAAVRVESRLRPRHAALRPQPACLASEPEAQICQQLHLNLVVAVLVLLLHLAVPVLALATVCSTCPVHLMLVTSK